MKLTVFIACCVPLLVLGAEPKRVKMGPVKTEGVVVAVESNKGMPDFYRSDDVPNTYHTFLIQEESKRLLRCTLIHWKVDKDAKDLLAGDRVSVSGRLDELWDGSVVQLEVSNCKLSNIQHTAATVSKEVEGIITRKAEKDQKGYTLTTFFINSDNGVEYECRAPVVMVAFVPAPVYYTVSRKDYREYGSGDRLKLTGSGYLSLPVGGKSVKGRVRLRAAKQKRPVVEEGCLWREGPIGG